jgi:hypothetical protein
MHFYINNSGRLPPQSAVEAGRYHHKRPPRARCQCSQSFIRPETNDVPNTLNIDRPMSSRPKRRVKMHNAVGCRCVSGLLGFPAYLLGGDAYPPTFNIPGFDRNFYSKE